MKKLPPASNVTTPAGTVPGEPSGPAPSFPQFALQNAQPPSIPDHELLRPIGGGSYGEVWLARSALGAYRAVKIVHRTNFDHDRPFEREFAGIQKFEPISRSHEGLVDLLQVGRNEAAGYFYYVMELADDAGSKRIEGVVDSWIDGGTLADHQSNTPSIQNPAIYTPRTLRSLLRPDPQPSTIHPQPAARLPLDDCIRLGLSLTNALACVHGQGLVHRDIKPSNIIFVGGVPKLADVGLVAGADESRSYVGTEGFIPPEGPGSPQADLYSLGIVLYELSTGKSHQDFPEPLPDLAAQPDHARWLEFNAVIHKACVSDVRERYQSAEEMHADLALLQRGASVRSKHTRERRLAVATKILIPAVILTLLVAGGWFLSSTLRRREVPMELTGTTNLEAFNACRLGRFFWNKRTGDGLKRAIEHFQKAVTLDPTYARAYAGLADCYNLLAEYGVSTPRESKPKAKAAALEALALDGKLAEAHASLGKVLHEYDWDWAGAEREYKRAIELDPNYPTARHWYGIYLDCVGRNQEAIAQIRKGIELDPLSLIINANLGYRLLYSRDYDAAIDAFQRTLEMDPNFPLTELHWLYEQQVRPQEALTEWERSWKNSGESPESLARLRTAFTSSGLRGCWQRELERLTNRVNQTYASPASMALSHLQLGDTNTAIALLAKSFDDRDPVLTRYYTIPLFDRLHSDPRFTELFRKMGLPHQPSAAAAPQAIKSLAVLPFDNDSSEPADEYLGTQMAEELGSTLAKVPELRVIGRNSAIALKGAKDVRQAAQQLNLGAVLDGRIQKANHKLRVSAQLINATDGFVLWSEVYAVEMADLLGLQTRLAEGVAQGLHLKLTDSARSRLVVKSTKNLEAYRLYLEGRFLWHRRSAGGLRKCVDLFQQAIQLDPGFARAYVGLADAYNIWDDHGLSPAKESKPKAREAVLKALALDNTLPEAHASLAKVLWEFDWDWDGARREHELAIQLDPNYPTARQWYSQFLDAVGRPEEALEQIKIGVQLDPLSCILLVNLGQRHAFAGRYDLATECAQKAHQVDPDYGNIRFGRFYEQAGRYDEALTEWERTLRYEGQSPEKFAAYQAAYAESGIQGFWRKRLELMHAPSNTVTIGGHGIAAELHALLGETERALECLEQAVAERNTLVTHMHREPAFASLRSHPRFTALLKRMGSEKFLPTAIKPAVVKSIAVLPFDNESPNKADEYLGTQLAEELSGALSRIPGLRVLGRDSAVALKHADDRRAIAQQLKLDGLIAGSVRKTGPQLHLTAQFMKPAAGQAAWALPPYDGEMKGIFGAQTDLVRKVAEALNVNVTLTEGQRLEIRPTLNLAAYEYYLLGRRHWNERTVAGVRRAIECFQQAIQQDPKYAQSYSGLADCYGFLGTRAFPTYEEAWTKAKENAEKAVQLGDRVSEAHASLGYVQENFEWDWEGAEKEFEGALELDPNNANVRSWYGIHLARLGKFAAGIQQARRAQELDPLSSLRRWVLCWMLTADRQYDAAIEQFDHNLRLTPNQQARQTVGSCYFYAGRYEEGITANQNAALGFGEAAPPVLQRYAALRAAYRASGPAGYWQKALELAMAEWKEGNNAMPIAVIHAWLGDKKQTLFWLEKAAEGHSHEIIDLNLTPVLDLVRAEPRYQAVLKQVGLERKSPKPPM